jgi:hypothetical protein
MILSSMKKRWNVQCMQITEQVYRHKILLTYIWKGWLDLPQDANLGVEQAAIDQSLLGC